MIQTITTVTVECDAALDVMHAVAAAARDAAIPVSQWRMHPATLQDVRESTFAITQPDDNTDPLWLNMNRWSAYSGRDANGNWTLFGAALWNDPEVPGGRVRGELPGRCLTADGFEGLK